MRVLCLPVCLSWGKHGPCEVLCLPVRLSWVEHGPCEGALSVLGRARALLGALSVLG